MKILLPDVWDLVPVRFHSYTTYVHKRIIEIEYNHSVDKEIAKYERNLVDLFNKAGKKNIFGGNVTVDNKIAFECIHKRSESKIFIGFYDGVLSIGFECNDENEKHMIGGWLAPHNPNW